MKPQHFIIYLFFLVCIYSLFCFASCNHTLSSIFLTEDKVVLGETGPDAPNKYDPNGCTDKLNYAPDPEFPEHTPIRYVRVNMHFIDRVAGGVNFSEEDGIAFSHYLIEEANRRLLKNDSMKLPIGNNTPVLPPRYEYVITGVEEDPSDDGIYFHKHDTLFVFNKKGGIGSIYSKDQYTKFGIRKNEVLNIFFLEHHPDSIASPTYKASGDGIGHVEWAKIGGAYMIHQDNPEMSIKEIAGHNVGILNHELGHSLGLRHTWASNDGCEDTPKNNNCWGYSRNDERCNKNSYLSNNMMDYNTWRSAITPCQLGIVHQKMSKETARQRKILLPTWCTYKADSSIRIPANRHIVWNSIKDLEGDVYISTGASLTLQCHLSMPENSRIIVEPGAKLILDGAVVTNRCKQQWQGIEIQKFEKVEGIVEMRGLSKIENAIHGLDMTKVSSAKNL